ncbi:MAG: F0F1 ATP synthase subunit B [Acidimicrobiales bacterium]
MFALITPMARLLAETPNPELQKPSNPILPDTSELIIALLAFLILFVAMRQFAFPAVRKAMDARTDRIRESLDSADKAKTDAESVLAEYQRQLADAKSEANRIIEEARQTADSLRKDLMAKAEAEATETRTRATADIDAAKERAMAELRGQLTTLTIELAERVVKRNLDRESNSALVEDYISSIGAGK